MRSIIYCFGGVCAAASTILVVAVASPRGERLPAHVADHLSDAAYVVPTVKSVPGRSALDHVQLMNIFLGVWVPYTVEAYSKYGRTSDW